MSMMQSDFGTINISDAVIASIVGVACKKTPGVVGMVSHNIKDGIFVLLKKEVESKGVKISYQDNVLNLEVYIKVIYGVNIPEICKQLAAIINEDIKVIIGEMKTNITIYIQDIQIDPIDKK